MRILVIEDDRAISDFIAKGLGEAGYIVEQAYNGEDGYSLLSAERYDAAIVDIMLPGIDGLSVISRIRGQGNTIPILVLSARRSVDERIEGLQKGGDDYLVKPFSFSELQARLQALIRRSGMKSGTGIMEACGIELNVSTREVRRDGVQVDLNPKEFLLLEYMMRNEGVVLSKTMIMENIWHYDFDPQTNIVDVLVSRLRSKIDRNSGRKLIHTIRGLGYVFKE